jgi:hypothetical protein
MSDLGIEAQAVEHAVILTPFVQCIEIEGGGAKAAALKLAQDRTHLCLKTGARLFLSLLRGIVELSGVVSEFLDHSIARRNVAILRRRAKRRSASIRKHDKKTGEAARTPRISKDDRHVGREGWPHP